MSESLEKELLRLKQQLEQEKAKNQRLVAKRKRNDQKQNLLSKQKIQQFVNKLLEDENVNIRYLPDVVEKQIYTNVLTIVMELLEHLVEDLNISFMGHNIKMSMDPTE